jgi:hypothetical protein
MTKNPRRPKQPPAKRGEMKEVYRLYTLSGDLNNLKKHLISIIGIEEGKVCYTYTPQNGVKEMLSSFDAPMFGGEIKDADPPDKYFKALEARFSQASRLLLVKTGEEGK